VVVNRKEFSMGKPYGMIKNFFSKDKFYACLLNAFYKKNLLNAHFITLLIIFITKKLTFTNVFCELYIKIVLCIAKLYTYVA